MSSGFRPRPQARGHPRRSNPLAFQTDRFAKGVQPSQRNYTFYSLNDGSERAPSEGRSKPACFTSKKAARYRNRTADPSVPETGNRETLSHGLRPAGKNGWLSNTAVRTVNRQFSNSVAW